MPICAEFRETLAAGGVKGLRLPPHSPNWNAFAERWVRSVKEECLSHLILFGERSLRKALLQFQEHYHAERNHPGKNNVLLFPAPARLEPGRRRDIRCCRAALKSRILRIASSFLSLKSRTVRDIALKSRTNFLSPKESGALNCSRLQDLGTLAFLRSDRRPRQSSYVRLVSAARLTCYMESSTRSGVDVGWKHASNALQTTSSASSSPRRLPDGHPSASCAGLFEPHRFR